MSSNTATNATTTNSTPSKHEGVRGHVDEFNKNFVNFSKNIHNGLHKGADKTSHKVADGTKKVFKHDN